MLLIKKLIVRGRKQLYRCCATHLTARAKVQSMQLSRHICIHSQAACAPQRPFVALSLEINLSMRLLRPDMSRIDA